MTKGVRQLGESRVWRTRGRQPGRKLWLVVPDCCRYETVVVASWFCAPPRVRLSVTETATQLYKVLACVSA